MAQRKLIQAFSFCHPAMLSSPELGSSRKGGFSRRDQERKGGIHFFAESKHDGFRQEELPG
jgi:hypothetical protein